MTKIKHPTKEEIIKTLLKEDPLIKKYEKLIVIIEHKKISKALGIIKAELINNGKVSLKGSMTCIPETIEDFFNWDLLKEGESHFDGYSIDFKGDTISSLIKQGLKNSMKEGRIPFIRK